MDLWIGEHFAFFTSLQVVPSAVSWDNDDHDHDDDNDGDHDHDHDHYDDDDVDDGGTWWVGGHEQEKLPAVFVHKCEQPPFFLIAINVIIIIIFIVVIVVIIFMLMMVIITFMIRLMAQTFHEV